ncbi:amidohydrolase family protein [Streptomyces sp. MI02-7b]|uniref:amidohydrolase family protein n=1 Tax=Streptomyces sp. MI02-7b TaxID=462941 RepID=UPI0029B6D59F|nr:amidohydrolase family protein [Streptomyces sp. MI02-7b]MDX3071152.1 amidohydrolase family protein [Streptomyces sp. MI02-7b]
MAAAAQDFAGLGGAIDVHAHYITPSYREALTAAGHTRPDGMPAIPEWSPESALALMDETGVATAMLSVSSPGVSLGDAAAAATLARAVNEEGAAVVREHPRRFGLLASLPLPDVPAALAELGHALDVLGADGVILLTNYDGVYLGDSRFAPLMAELHRRETVVLLHPTSPVCGERTALGFPHPMVEFLFDSTRAVAELALRHVLERCPGIRFVVPHAGAALPVMADRIAVFAQMSGTGVDVLAALRALHYDVAGAALPRALPALLSLVDPDRLVYGSDYPFTPAPVVKDLAAALAATGVLDAAGKHLVTSGNARSLFPRLTRLTG